jgi:hypothetical protein
VTHLTSPPDNPQPLTLGNNQISDYQKAKLKKALPNCKITFD